MNAAPLGIAGVYGSYNYSTQGFGRIVVSLYSDVAGSLAVQQSNDGTNWDIVTTFAYTGTTVLGYSVEVMAEFYRLVYTNGAGAQATFRLSSRLRKV